MASEIVSAGRCARTPRHRNEIAHIVATLPPRKSPPLFLWRASVVQPSGKGLACRLRGLRMAVALSREVARYTVALRKVSKRVYAG